MASAQKDQLSGIKYPGVNDVLFGRGGNATLHPGNVQFRILVDDYKEKYASASRSQKSEVSNEVVAKWRSRMCPKNLVGGRFLTLTDPSNKQTSLWHDVGDKEAARKASQLLRERRPKAKFPQEHQQNPQVFPQSVTSLPSYATVAPYIVPAPIQSMNPAAESRFPPGVAAGVGSSSGQPSTMPPSVPQHLEVGAATPQLSSSLQQQLILYQLLQKGQSAQTQTPAAQSLPTVAPPPPPQQQDSLQLQLEAAEQQVRQAQIQVEQQALLIQQAAKIIMMQQQQQQQQVQPQSQQQVQQQLQPPQHIQLLQNQQLLQQQGQQLLQQLSLLQQHVAQLPAASGLPSQATASAPQVHQPKESSQLTESNILIQQLELFNQGLQQSSEQSTRSSHSSSLTTGESNSIPRYINTEKHATPGRMNSPSSSEMMTGESDSGSGGDGENSSEDVVGSYTSNNSLSRYAFSTCSDEYPNATNTPTTGNLNESITAAEEALQQGGSYNPTTHMSRAPSSGVAAAKKSRSFGVYFSDTSSIKSSAQICTASELGSDSAFENSSTSNGNDTKKSRGIREVSTYASSRPRSLSSSSSSRKKRKRSRSKGKTHKRIPSHSMVG